MKAKNSENAWIKTLSFILAISIGLNVILILKRYDVFPSKRKILIEKSQLNKKVSQYRNELNKLKGISTRIDQVISDANTKIEAKEKQIRNLKNAKENEIKSLVHQLDSLKERYVTVIDSLLVEREIKKVINTKIDNLEETINQLNKKLGYAGRMVTDNFKVTPIKKSGNPTALAKRTHELDICFDILENRITKSGTKNIYVIITSPDATVIFNKISEEKIFQHPEYNKLAEYSCLDQLNYENKKMKFCTKVTPSVELKPGLYVAEIYTDDYKLAMTTFSVK